MVLSFVSPLFFHHLVPLHCHLSLNGPNRLELGATLAEAGAQLIKGDGAFAIMRDALQAFTVNMSSGCCLFTVASLLSRSIICCLFRPAASFASRMQQEDTRMHTHEG